MKNKTKKSVAHQQALSEDKDNDGKKSGQESTFIPRSWTNILQTIQKNKRAFEQKISEKCRQLAIFQLSSAQNAYFQSIIIPFCEEYSALPRSTADQFRWIYRLKEPKIPGVLGIRQIKELLMSIISDIYRHRMEKFLLVTSLL